MSVLENFIRNKNYLFLNVEPEAALGSESWKRIGKSTEWTDTMNAKTTTYDFIEDSGPTDVIENYQPSTSMPLKAYIGDPVYEYVFDLYVRQDVGDKTSTKALRVFQNKNAQGAYIAQVTDCTITIDSYNMLTGVITFQLKQNGTPTLGTAVPRETQTGSNVYEVTFTPDNA